MLYHELSSLEHAGATFFDGSGMWDLRVSASAKSSFQSWMAKQTTELDGSDADEDAAVFARVAANGGTIETQAEAEAVLRVERRTGGGDETELDEDGLVTSRQVGDAPEEDDDEEDESEQPHSMEAAGQWAAGQWGHLAPSDVTKPTHIEAVLQNPHSAVVDGGRATEENVAQVFSQSGILPVPSALAELPNRLERRQHLAAALQQQQHGLLKFPSHIYYFQLYIKQAVSIKKQY